jgi:archaemetzincin
VNAIHLLPLGSADQTVVGDLGPYLEHAFRASVAIHGKAVPIEPFYDAQRAQYNSTRIIGHLLERYVQDAAATPAKILGVAGQDLFIPILTYVFGEAQLGGLVGVVSYYRLPNERYGLPADRNLFAQRLLKEAMHELGHTYGLIHCRSLDCVMHISTYVEDIDTKQAAFCRECEQKLFQAESRR